MEQVNKKILIMGNDPEVQGTLIGMITERFGQDTIYSTGNASGGIEMAKALQPDVLIISTLENGFDSFEVCSTFKNDEILRDIPMVFIPGPTEDKKHRVRAFEAGFDCILSSAADEEELAACIRAMLNQKEVNDAKRAETKRLLQTINERAKELQESEWQLLEAQSIAHTGHWKLDIESNQLHWSDEVYRIFGYIPGEFSPTYEAFLNSVHPSDKEFVHKAYLNSLEQKNLYNIEHRVLLKNGSVKYVSESCVTYYDTSGIPKQSIGTVKDITERKQIELRLEAELTRLEGILAGTNVGTWEWNVETGATKYNARWAEIIGYTLEELSPLSSETWIKYAHPEDVVKSQELIHAHFRGETEYYEFEARMRHKNGDWIWVLEKGKVISRNNEGKPLMMFGTHLDINERKMSELRLEAERNRLAAIIEGTNVGTWEWNIQTGETVFDARWAGIIGYTLEEISPVSINTWEKFSHPDDLKKSSALLEAHFSGELEFYECEIRMRHKNGQWVWVLDKGKVISHTEDGKPLAMFGTHLDINERRLAEENLRQNRNMLDNILNSIPQSVFWKDKNSNYLGCNTQFSKAVGLQNPEEIIGMSDFGLPWSKEEAEAYRADDRFVMDNKAPKAHIIEPLQQAGGAKLWIDTTKIPLLDDQGAVTGVVGIYEDITERIHAEAELQIKNRAIESSINAIAMSDLSGHLTYVNTAFLKLWGYEHPNEVIGRSSLDFWSNREDPMAVVDALRNQGYWKGEMVARRSDKSLFDAEVSANMILNQDGTPLCLQASFIDITARKQAEEALQQAADIIHHMQVGLYVYQLENPEDDRSLRLLATNPSSRKLSGVSTEESIGKYIDEIFPALRSQGIPKRFADVVRTGIAGEFEDYYYTPEKVLEAAYVVKAFPLPNHCVGITFDNITGRKKDEILLRESEEKYRKLISTVPDLIVLTDIVGNITFINNVPFLAFEQMPKESFIGHNILSFVAEDDLPKAIANTSQMLESKLGPKEYKLKTSEGNYIQTEVNGDVIYDAQNNPVGMIYTIRDITERLQAEKAIRLSEERFKSIVAVSNTGAWEFHHDTEFLWSSKEYFTMLGYNPEDFKNNGSSNIQKNWIDLLHPDDQIKAPKHFADYLESGSVGIYENYFRMRHLDGSWVWIWSRGQTLRDTDGNLTKRTLGTHIDITERMLAQQQLLNEKEKAESNESRLIEAQAVTKVGSWETDLASLKVFWSAETYKIFELDPDLFSPDHNSFLSFVHPNDREKVDEAFRLSFSSDESNAVEHRILTANGNVKYTEERWRIIKDKEGNPVKAFGTCQDITDRKNIEIELITARENAEKREEKISIQNQEILFNNERLESLLKVSQLQTNSIQELLDFALSQAVELTRSKIGYIYFYSEEKKQFILNTWSKDVMKECQVMEPQTTYNLDDTGCWGEAVRQRKPIVMNDYQADNPLKKGTPEGHVKLKKFLTIPVIFDEKIVAVAGVANKPDDYNDSDIRQLTLLMDNVWKISERLTLIKDLRHAKEKAEESDKLKSAFLANMSHEIRTPMNGILGFAELLNEPDLTGEEQKQFIALINKSGQRMLNIINDIVDISKIEAGIMETRLSETNIHEQIAYIFNIFKADASAKGLEFELNNLIPDKGFTLITDREKLFAILTNLVKNAIKYTHKGSVEIGCRHKGNFLEFYVKDTGIGIPQHRQRAIFERFIQADIEDKMAYQGAGLGLTISQKYAEMLGGEIRVESNEGVGSTFYLTLARVQQKPKVTPSAPPDSTEKPVEIRKLKVLAVDDDEVSEMLLDKIINKISSEVLKASTGTEAVEIAKANPDIELILMDIRMPGMSGIEATKAIRQFNKDVVIIAQTAFGLSGDRKKAMEAGCTDYITKPISKNDLFTIIQRYFKA